MQSLSGLIGGGGGRFSHYERLKGSGLWTSPAGVQTVRVALAGAGQGGATPLIGYKYDSYYDYGTAGNAGGYLEIDYPLLGAASVAYSVGSGSAGTVTSGLTTTQNGVASVATVGGIAYVLTIPVTAATITSLAANWSVSGTATAAAIGATSLTVSCPMLSRVQPGWFCQVYGIVSGTVDSISGSTVTLTTGLTAAVPSGALVVFTTSGRSNISVPSAGLYFSNPYIYSATSLIYLTFPNSGSQPSWSSAAPLLLSSAPSAAMGGATTFGDLVASGGGGGGVVYHKASGAMVAATYPGPLVYVPGGSNAYTAQTGTGCGGLQGALFGCGGGGAAGSVTNPVGGPGGIGAGGGGMAGYFAALSPAPTGGKGGDGMIVVMY